MTDPANPGLPDDEFQDPLENYEPAEYADPLEEALDTRTVSELQTAPCETVSATTPVKDAIARLASIAHACLLVERQGKLVGVFTDRDLLNRVALEYDRLKNRPVSEVMTTDPVFVNEDDPAAAALNVIAVSGHRHVPVLHLDGTIIGVITPRRITEFLLRHSANE